MNHWLPPTSLILTALLSIPGCGPGEPGEAAAINSRGSGAEPQLVGLSRSDWQAIPRADSLLTEAENSARSASVLSNRLQDPRRSPRWPAMRLYIDLFAEAYELAFERNLWSPGIGLRTPRTGPADVGPRVGREGNSQEPTGR